MSPGLISERLLALLVLQEGVMVKLVMRLQPQRRAKRGVCVSSRFKSSRTSIYHKLGLLEPQA